VNLVDDDVLYVLQGTPEFLAGQHCLQRLGRRHEHVRRVVGLFLALVIGCVAVAHVDVDIERLTPPLQAVPHVAVERAQRRDVEGADAEPLLAGERIENREHRRLGLAAAGRRNHEDVLAGRERGERATLWRSWRLEATLREGLPNPVAERGKRRRARNLAVCHRRGLGD
jgi:hypothetical protein